MNIFLTLDYELFSGPNPGTVEHSIIKPTMKLLEVADKYGVKFVFFVDSGYLVKLAQYQDQYPQAKQDYEQIVTQLKVLDSQGHDIQLHIHPHWEDCTYDEDGWHIDTSRFRIHHFSQNEIEDIVARYKKALTDIVGDKVFAYRAGGWCLQPFDKLYLALKQHHIWLDSTAYEDGYNSSATHFYDFRNMPNKTLYHFEEDPIKEVSNGFFTEIPISTYKVSPIFFWKFAFYKKFGKNEHKTYGDGIPAGGSSNSSMLRMLTKPSKSLVSMDGLRASLLQKSLIANAKKEPDGNLVVIGHPKAVTPYSLGELDKFLAFATQKHQVITFGKYIK